MTRFALLGIFIQALLCSLLIARNGEAQNKYLNDVSISISKRDSPLRGIFSEIENKTDFAFTYNHDIVDDTYLLSMKFKNASLYSILSYISKEAKLKFKRIDENIYVTKNRNTGVEIEEFQRLLQNKISGKVTSEEDGEPLPGVSILIKGTSSGTTTDISGNYSLSVSSEDVIQFSFIGYRSQEIPVGNQTEINIKLKADLEQLEEVVVVGYGTQERAKVTGAVAQVKSKDLMTAPAANVSEMLVGKAPGLMTKQVSGIPGDDAAELSIRGFGEPLVLVDGVQMSFNRLDPNDIESISVLKDASAAIYGSRAGNGVILVTTKRGKNGKPKISYHGNVSFQNPTVLPNHVNSWEYAELLREGELNYGLETTYTPEDIEKFKQGGDPSYVNEDWFDALYKDWVPMQSHNLSVNGGSENIKYFMSAGFLDQASLFQSGDWNFNRYNVRSNIDAKISKKLTASFDIAYRKEIRDQPNMSLQEAYVQLLTAQPVWPSTLPDPSRGGAYSGFSQRSPVAYSTKSYSGFVDDSREYINAQIGLTYEIIEGLSAKGQLAYMGTNEYRKSHNKPFDVFSYNYNDQAYNYEGTSGASVLTERFRNYRQLYPLVSLNYIKNINKHNIKGMVLAEFIDEFARSSSVTRRDLLSSEVPFQFAGSQDGISSAGSANEKGRASYVARVNYDYNAKYLLEATFRADGSYRFADGKKWGYFPSISAGWRLSDEAFLEGVSFLDNLKLRASYSQMGYDQVYFENVEQEFRHIQGYTIREGQRDYYMHGGNLGRLITPTGLANPDWTWYKMTTYNLGMDVDFFEGKLGFEFDYFYRLRDDILARPFESYPSTFGADLPPQNINANDNRGFEISVKHRNQIGEFSYSINAFTAFTREKYVEYSEPNYEDPDEIRIFQKQGQWVNRWIGYVSDGMFMTQDQIDSHPVNQDQNENKSLRPGDIIYKDLNGDGIINWKDQDVIGFGEFPDLSYGLNLSANWKGFSMTMLWQGASRYNMNIGGAARSGFSNWSIPFDYHYKYRWTPDPDNPGVNINPDAQLPAMDGTGQGTTANNNLTSDFWLQDNTYLRLRNLNIGYSLPTQLIEKANLQQVRLYVAGTNILTFSKLGIYKDSWDPEGPQLQQGRTYPPLKTWTLGLNITL